MTEPDIDILKELERLVTERSFIEATRYLGWAVKQIKELKNDFDLAAVAYRDVQRENSGLRADIADLTEICSIRREKIKGAETMATVINEDREKLRSVLREWVDHMTLTQSGVVAIRWEYESVPPLVARERDLLKRTRKALQ